MERQEFSDKTEWSRYKHPTDITELEFWLLLLIANLRYVHSASRYFSFLRFPYVLQFSSLAGNVVDIFLTIVLIINQSL